MGARLAAVQAAHGHQSGRRAPRFEFNASEWRVFVGMGGSVPQHFAARTAGFLYHDVSLSLLSHPRRDITPIRWQTSLDVARERFGAGLIERGP